MSVNGVGKSNSNIPPLKAGLEQKAIEGDEKLKSIFNKIDANGDGVLSQEEIDEHGVKDKNGDGKITKRDARKFIKENGLKSEHVKKKDVMRFLEKSGEGTENVASTQVLENGSIEITYKDETKKIINNDRSYDTVKTDENGTTTRSFTPQDVLKKEIVENDTVKTETSYADDGKTPTHTTITDGNEGSTTEISYNNGLKEESFKTEQNGTKTTIKYAQDEANKPETKTVEQGTTISNFEYLPDGSERIASKTENKGNEALEKNTQYKYSEDGSFVEDITQKGTNTHTVNNCNADGKRLEQTKTVGDKEYKATYDGEGNTTGVVIQNRETIEQVAKKFNCTVEQLKELNGKDKFQTGDTIKVPGELESDSPELVNRKTSQEAISEQQRDVQVAQQRRAQAQRLAQQRAEQQRLKDEETAELKEKFGLIKRTKEETIEVTFQGNKKFKLTQIGTAVHGRKVCVDKKGKYYVVSHDNRALRSDYLQAHKRYHQNLRGKTVSGMNDVSYVRDNNGKVWYFNDKTGKAIVKKEYKQVVQKESQYIADKLHNAATVFMGTDEEKLTEGVNQIYSREILNNVNKQLRAKDSTYDVDTQKTQMMPVEALILDEMSHTAARPLLNNLLNSGNMTTQEAARTIKREIEHEVHGGFGITRTAELNDIMQMCNDRDVRIEIENQFKKDHPELKANDDSFVRQYISEDGWTDQQVDQFDANWIKTGAYAEAQEVYLLDEDGNYKFDENGQPMTEIKEGDQAHRNNVIGRLIFTYQDKQALNKGLAACNENPDSFDYQYLEEAAGKYISRDTEGKYSSNFSNQDNVQRYLAGFHKKEGQVDTGELSASNTCLFKGEKPARIQAEEVMYSVKSGDFSQAFTSFNPETYSEIADMIKNGDIDGVKSLKDLYNKAYNSTSDSDEKISIQANAVLSGIKFSDDEITQICVNLMHSIDSNMGSANSSTQTTSGLMARNSQGVVNSADYRKEQLKAILQSNPQIISGLRDQIKNGNFEEVSKTNMGIITQSNKKDTSKTYLDLLDSTNYIAKESKFLDEKGKEITDPDQIEAIKEQNLATLSELRQEVARLEREFKKTIDDEGTLSDMANGISEYSGLGTDRQDVANAYRSAKNLLAQLEAAARGELRDSKGQVVKMQDLAQDEINKLQSTNSNYQSTIQTGKMVMILAPVIVATAAVSGGLSLAAGAAAEGSVAAAVLGSSWTSAAVAGVTTGASTYGMNALEYNTSHTGATDEARERNMAESLIAGGSTFIGAAQMKYIPKMLNNANAFIRGGGRLSTVLASDMGVGAAGEYVQSGEVTINGVAMNAVFSATGNLIGLKALSQKHKPAVVPTESGIYGKTFKRQDSVGAKKQIAHHSDVHIKTDAAKKKINTKTDELVSTSTSGEELARAHNELDAGNRDLRRLNQEKINKAAKNHSPEEQAKFNQGVREHNQAEVEHIFERNNELSQEDLRILREYTQNTNDKTVLEELKQKLKTKEKTTGGVTAHYKEMYDAIDNKIKSIKPTIAKQNSEVLNSLQSKIEKKQGLSPDDVKELSAHIKTLDSADDIAQLNQMLSNKKLKMTNAQRNQLQSELTKQEANVIPAGNNNHRITSAESQGASIDTQRPIKDLSTQQEGRTAGLDVFYESQAKVAKQKASAPTPEPKPTNTPATRVSNEVTESFSQGTVTKLSENLKPGKTAIAKKNGFIYEISNDNGIVKITNKTRIDKSANQIKISDEIYDTFSDATQNILADGLENQGMAILEKGEIAYIVKNDNGNLVITNKMNKNELCRTVGNDGKQLPDEYLSNSLQVRQSLDAAIDNGSLTSSVQSYTQTIENAHKLAYGGADGQNLYYMKHGELLKMDAGHMHDWEILSNNYVERAEDVELIARRLGDNYSTNEASSVELFGISSDALPQNIGTRHSYPGASAHSQYFKQMHRTMQEATTMLKKGIRSTAQKQAFLEKLAEHYQYAANVRPFEQINNSLFMNEVNTMLTKAGMNTMPHGILDHAAQRLQPNSFKKYFVEQYYNTSVNANYRPEARTRIINADEIQAALSSKPPKAPKSTPEPKPTPSNTSGVNTDNVVSWQKMTIDGKELEFAIRKNANGTTSVDMSTARVSDGKGGYEIQKIALADDINASSGSGVTPPKKSFWSKIFGPKEKTTNLSSKWSDFNTSKGKISLMVEPDGRVIGGSVGGHAIQVNAKLRPGQSKNIAQTEKGQYLILERDSAGKYNVKTSDTPAQETPVINGGRNYSPQHLGQTPSRTQSNDPGIRIVNRKSSQAPQHPAQTSATAQNRAPQRPAQPQKPARPVQTPNRTQSNDPGIKIVDRKKTAAPEKTQPLTFEQQRAQKEIEDLIRNNPDKGIHDLRKTKYYRGKLELTLEDGVINVEISKSPEGVAVKNKGKITFLKEGDLFEYDGATLRYKDGILFSQNAPNSGAQSVVKEAKKQFAGYKEPSFITKSEGEDFGVIGEITLDGESKIPVPPKTQYTESKTTVTNQRKDYVKPETTVKGKYVKPETSVRETETNINARKQVNNLKQQMRQKTPTTSQDIDARLNQRTGDYEDLAGAYKREERIARDIANEKAENAAVQRENDYIDKTYKSTKSAKESAEAFEEHFSNIDAQKQVNNLKQQMRQKTPTTSQDIDARLNQRTGDYEALAGAYKREERIARDIANEKAENAAVQRENDYIDKTYKSTKSAKESAEAFEEHFSNIEAQKQAQRKEYVKPQAPAKFNMNRKEARTINSLSNPEMATHFISRTMEEVTGGKFPTKEMFNTIVDDMSKYYGIPNKSLETDLKKIIKKLTMSCPGEGWSEIYTLFDTPKSKLDASSFSKLNSFIRRKNLQVKVDSANVVRPKEGSIITEDEINVIRRVSGNESNAGMIRDAIDDIIVVLKNNEVPTPETLANLRNKYKDFEGNFDNSLFAALRNLDENQNGYSRLWDAMRTSKGEKPSAEILQAIENLKKSKNIQLNAKAQAKLDAKIKAEKKQAAKIEAENKARAKKLAAAGAQARKSHPQIEELDNKYGGYFTGEKHDVALGKIMDEYEQYLKNHPMNYDNFDGLQLKAVINTNAKYKFDAEYELFDDLKKIYHPDIVAREIKLNDLSKMYRLEEREILNTEKVIEKIKQKQQKGESITLEEINRMLQDDVAYHTPDGAKSMVLEDPSINAYLNEHFSTRIANNKNYVKLTDGHLENVMATQQRIIKAINDGKCKGYGDLYNILDSSCQLHSFNYGEEQVLVDALRNDPIISKHCKDYLDEAMKTVAWPVD